MFEDTVDGITYYDKPQEIMRNNEPIALESLKSATRQERIESLKLATEVVLKVNHFEKQYENPQAFLEDMELIYKIADRNLKYILGEK